MLIFTYLCDYNRPWESDPLWEKIMTMHSPTVQKIRKLLPYACLAAGFLAIVHSSNSMAGATDQAKRIHDRIAGVPPSQAELADMLAIMDPDNDGVTSAALAKEAALAIPLNNKYFYNVTLKQWITPWTNEEQTVFAPLNDYTATAIGLIASEADFRRVLYDDVLYVGASNLSLPAYSVANNNHYEALEALDVSLATALQASTQSANNGGALPANATAGIMTTRAAAKAFFVAGTNRAMLRFTLMNHLCNDLEQLKDTTRPPDRIRQDVSRSPGGDSRIFLNNCIGCHSGMDPLAQAYAHYEWEGKEGEEAGHLTYKAESVEGKYRINDSSFKWGYVTTSDLWTNYWRKGQNTWLGWDPALPGEGNGAKSLGMELANSNQFAECQVTKVFKAVCLREPESVQDGTQIDTMVTTFKSGYNVKQVFAESAAYCMGD